jgi:hypothetical protein
MASMTAKYLKGAKHGRPGKKSLVTVAAVTGGVLAAAGAGAFDVFTGAGGPGVPAPITHTPSLAAAILPNPTPNPLLAAAQPIVAPDPGLAVGGGAAPAGVDPAAAPPAADPVTADSDPAPVLCGGTPVVGQDCVTQAFSPVSTFDTQMVAFSPQNLGLQTAAAASAFSGFPISGISSFLGGGGAPTATPSSGSEPASTPTAAGPARNPFAEAIGQMTFNSVKVAGIFVNNGDEPGENGGLFFGNGADGADGQDGGRAGLFFGRGGNGGDGVEGVNNGDGGNGG